MFTLTWQNWTSSLARWEQHISNCVGLPFFQRAPIIFCVSSQSLTYAPFARPHFPAMTMGLRVATITRPQTDVPTMSAFDTSPGIACPTLRTSLWSCSPLLLLPKIWSSFHFIFRGELQRCFQRNSSEASEMSLSMNVEGSWFGKEKSSLPPSPNHSFQWGSTILRKTPLPPVWESKEVHFPHVHSSFTIFHTKRSRIHVQFYEVLPKGTQVPKVLPRQTWDM